MDHHFDALKCPALGANLSACVAMSSSKPYHAISRSLPPPLTTSSTRAIASTSPAEQRPRDKPTVIGLYGLPGSGKTTMLHHLKASLSSSAFNFYEGSDIIASMVPGGLAAFEQLSAADKEIWRSRAITAIGIDTMRTSRAAIVTGHFMFWDEGVLDYQSVHTAKDAATYTHIVYLGIDADRLLHRRAADCTRRRPQASLHHLRQWQQTEVACLRSMCRYHGILFTVLPDDVARVSALMNYFVHHGASANMARAEARLDEILHQAGHHGLETALVIDGDGTLAAEDTSALFWKSLPHQLRDGTSCNEAVLHDLFSGPLGYSDTAFRQAMLLCEEAADNELYESLCESVARAIAPRAEFMSLLQAAGPPNRHVTAIVVTCGLGRLWQRVLERAGLSSWVRVVGGGRVSDGFVVNATVKAALVARLQALRLRVVAFGDGPLDLPMLERADEAIVVVGEEPLRSYTMEAALRQSVEARRLCGARQALMPCHVLPRLDPAKLPQVCISDGAFIDSVLARRVGTCNDTHRLEAHHFETCHVDTRRLSTLDEATPCPASSHLVHATNRAAAKLLMTPTRDATASGEALRRSHRRVGTYLALEFLPDALGLDIYCIPHVQGHDTDGFRIRAETRTAVVAVMRAGEPMAFGVADVLPRAAFIHAHLPEDLDHRHLLDLDAVVLVDAVVNSGVTVRQFVDRVRLLQPSIRIVIVAGVVQAAASGVVRAVNDCTLIALRISENSFKGTGTVDTGNRLFNTTHLP